MEHAVDHNVVGRVDIDKLVGPRHPPLLDLRRHLARHLDEIAEAAGIPDSLVKVRVFRAVRMLRKQLSSLGIKDAKP